MNSTNTVNDPLIVEKSIVINASVNKVWEALTKPELIKQYFFGTNTTTDWKKGSLITFEGEWDGKKYLDKGTILDVEPEKFVRYSYWSSMSGTEDKLENYAKVTYELSPDGDNTKLTITQDGSKTPESRDHSASNWGMIMESLKKLVEN